MRSKDAGARSWLLAFNVLLIFHLMVREEHINSHRPTHGMHGAHANDKHMMQPIITASCPCVLTADIQSCKVQMPARLHYVTSSLCEGHARKNYNCYIQSRQGYGTNICANNKLRCLGLHKLSDTVTVFKQLCPWLQEPKLRLAFIQ